MQDVQGDETPRGQTGTDSQSVVQALDSDNPEVRAEGFNAALRLLFRLNGLTQKRQTQEQIDREAGLIQLPVGQALQSDDLWTRDRATGVMNGFLATLQEVARKKRHVEKMIAQLREEISLARRARQGKIFCTFLLLLSAVALFFTQGTHIVMFWWLIFPLSGLWSADRSRGHAVIQKLSETWDPRAIGVLAVVAQERDPMLKHQAQQVLIDLLPRVRASDAAYIDTEGMEVLILLLREDAYALQLALLQAFEQIGDARAIPNVLHLRDSLFVRPELRKAAAECLPALESRVRLARESSTLLRASSGINSVEAAAVLLRPAAGAPVSAENLLRPVEDLSTAPSFRIETADSAPFSVKIPSESLSDDTTLRSGTSLN